MARSWIKGAIKRPGALRRTAKVKKGQRIPANKLRSLAKKKGITGRRARLAITFRKWAANRKGKR